MVPTRSTAETQVDFVGVYQVFGFGFTIVTDAQERNTQSPAV